MHVVAIIQARMGSSRLPGKVLKDLGGKTMLARVVQRVQQTRLVGNVVVATTDLAADEPIVAACNRLGVDVYRGSEQDVLDRYYRTAQAYKADAIVRVTSDCPLIDPEITDRVIRVFLDEKPDYASNILKRSYPRGLDTEVVTFSALEQAWRAATESYQRVHVLPYITEHEGVFRLVSVTGRSDYSNHRWTVDVPDDLAFARAVYARLADGGNFNWRDVLRLLAGEPWLQQLNCQVLQKAVEEG
ncbi:MAG: glycosyltransferase family protein [Phycisphaerae bacterium]|nr:glycosyltransferase family protein [Phycisphaerae bacterium]